MVPCVRLTYAESGRGEHHDDLLESGSPSGGIRIMGRMAGSQKHPDTAIDPVTKDLVDNLLIPYLIEEFLRLHGPIATGVQQINTAISSPVPSHSELDPTP
jgi:hypothetical protein